MRASALVALGIGVALVACGDPPPPKVAREPERDAAPPEPEVVVAPPPAPPSGPPSTATYEEALSVPEALDVHDGHLHLTDAQLTGPMRGALGGCKVPSNAKIVIKTAVQNGRAIGVTVEVRFVRPKNARPPSGAAAKAEAKAASKIAACVDKNVRVISWPPSRRRDSFTTEF